MPIFIPSKCKFKKQFGLQEFATKQKRICIKRAVGGLGDILMHRFMFEDFKRLMPECHLSFACPTKYHIAVSDHPFLDAVVDSYAFNPDDYFTVYNTTTSCGTYESMIAPKSDKHRSDIWAEKSCGLKLQNHNLNLNLPKEMIEFGKDLLNKTFPNSNKPNLILCPKSAMPTKDLQPETIVELCKKLKEIGFNVVALHETNMPIFNQIKVPMFCGFSILQWMGILESSDYVISVDTASVHYCIDKPLVSIFTFADGKIYTKYHKKNELVQKHRDNGDWYCGPCYAFESCIKTNAILKPCLTELTVNDIMDGVNRLLIRFPWTKSKINVPFSLKII